MTESSFAPAGPPAGFRKIVVALDFSPASERALALARTRFPGAQLRLVHVTDARVTTTPDLMGGVTPVGDPALLQTLGDVDTRRLERSLHAGEETEQLVGDPVTGIVEAAERWGADLIVMGTHHQGALEHFFMGSTAEKVLARSAVPVLAVPVTGGR
ncbi:universal stress protein [Deinococcus petrolearius]|uniref:Universal stress protein n=1 Tax=Deinococcus petrolearius TaxID=1751295 RepID=A0ABW1DJW9_9DEIO